MSIGPIVKAALPFFQSQASSLQTDTCTVTRIDGSQPASFDPDTGQYSAQQAITVYQGPCRVSAHKTRFDRVVEAGGEPTTLIRIFVDFPVDDTEFEVDDIVHVTASDDPALVGAQLRIRQLTVGSQITARRIGCELNAG